MSGIRLPGFECHQLRVFRVSPVQVFAGAVVVEHEGRHLGDGGVGVGGGAHGAVLTPPLAPLRLVLHPLPFQYGLHLKHTLASDADRSASMPGLGKKHSM